MSLKNNENKKLIILGIKITITSKSVEFRENAYESQDGEKESEDYEKRWAKQGCDVENDYYP